MKAFTLVETLIAIAMILLAILGPFQLIQKSLAASYTARDQLVATALAEEGLEYVRYVRDSNYLVRTVASPLNVGWLRSFDGMLGGPCFTSAGCTVDARGVVPPAVCGSTCPVLKIHPTGKYYTQATGAGYTDSRFTRKVVFENVDGGSDNAVKVTVTVSFTSAHVPYTVTVSDYFYNWL